MRILLLGEFSGVHTQLKQALSHLGHEVTVASFGDGFKSFKPDIQLGQAKGRIAAALEQLAAPVLNYSKLVSYDVLQLINPFNFNEKYPTRHIVERIIKNSGRSFLLAAGCDSVFREEIVKSDFAYHPCGTCLALDQRSDTCVFEAPWATRWNDRIACLVNGIIPISDSYAYVYRNYPNVRELVPMPIDTTAISYVPNIVKGPVRFFHGKSRGGFKGTPIIIEAFEEAKQRWPSDIETTVSSGLPFDQYMEAIVSHNVVVDQTYGYGLGMNSLFGMARGRILMTCFEERFFKLGENPAVRIEPNVAQIVDRIGMIIENRNRIEAWGQASRNYVEGRHNSVKIAQEFLRTWSANTGH